MKHLAAYENVVVPCTTTGTPLRFGVLDSTKTLTMYNDAEIAKATGMLLTDTNWKNFKKNRFNVWNKIDVTG